jgi:hypothetical protein
MDNFAGAKIGENEIKCTPSVFSHFLVNNLPKIGLKNYLFLIFIGICDKYLPLPF